MPDQTNPYETKTIADVLSELKVQVATGLSDEEVKQRQTTYGLNEVVGEKTITGSFISETLLGTYSHYAGDYHCIIIFASKVC